jgi:hypothetical protein
LFSGTTISSLEIESPETVAYLYQKFFIESTSFAVVAAPSSSKDLANIFLITHLPRVSFIYPNSFGIISLKSNLP